MIASMTGYGRGVGSANDIEVTVEIRSVNNRFLDTVLKVPRSLANYEQQIRELIGKHIKRGRINVWISVSREDNGSSDAKLNQSLLKAYMNVSKQMKNDFGIQGNLDMNLLLALPDILEVVEDDDADEKIWNCTKDVLSKAIQGLQDMRLREGKELKKDFNDRINALDTIINSIEEITKNGPSEQLAKLKNRLEKILTNEPVDDGRLEMELALMSDKLDVTEECVRFHSHNKLFLEMLDAEESQGRKLNFLLQEMNREANTIGVKSASSEVSHLVVQIKEEVERVREQIQNIE